MKAPLRILVIEDSENDALMTLRHIEKGDYGIDYEIVQTADRMQEALKAKAWDIILCDYHMPRFSGFAALEIFKKSGLDIPFIIISGTIGEEIAVECMKAGADDYLIKGHLTRLLPAIERGIREAKNRAERKRLERELIQSQKLESLGTLASGIAHDFNNILAIISGYSELGERKAVAHQPDLTKSFEAISLASRRGALLVSQLLTFARKTETIFRSVEINALVAEITMFFGETFPKTIGISTDLQAGIPGILADVTQLHQVFMNLCVNARDAMPAGGALTIRTRLLDHGTVQSRFPKATARQYIAVDVSDTGSGMDGKTREKIFDPFFTTKGPSKGTGLGLALVHSIMENHRALIEVETELGKGTAFRLYFPVEENPIAYREPVKPAQAGPSGGAETILLIEDELLIVDMVQSVLDGKGYRVLLARDGEEGVATFIRHRNEIKVVLSDFGLPKLRGDEVAHRIKKLDPKAKFILFSGFFNPEIRAGMAKIGVDRFLQKPFTFAELGECLRSVLDAET